MSNEIMISDSKVKKIPKVAILMGTFNGEKYLEQQLNSFLNQTFQNWILCVSDDGSQDKTKNILYSFQEKIGLKKCLIGDGSRQGFVKNFLSLACDEKIEADYFAFSDQDDVWDNSKLERAVSWLAEGDDDVPAMYCSRTRLIDSSGKIIGMSPFFKFQPCFRNALVQSIAGANTIVFNQAARKILMRAGANVLVPSHDWWVYLIVTATGGRVKFDTYATVNYRQHADNLVGTNLGVKPILKRIIRGMGGTLRIWTNQNIEALKIINEEIKTPQSEILTAFSNARNLGWLQRIIQLHNSGIRRQTILGNVLLWFAVFLKKI